MNKNTTFLFLFIFCVVIRKCFMDLTGVHYLHTINCSSSSSYIPHGPYLFSHHWPFTSITIHYQRHQTLGVCYRNGSLYFFLNKNKLCSGMYSYGKAKLLCRFEANEYCFINMTTTDDSQLTCHGLKVKSMTFGLIGLYLFIVIIYKNHLFN